MRTNGPQGSAATTMEWRPYQEPAVFDRARQLVARAKAEIAKQGRISEETAREMAAVYQEVKRHVVEQPETDRGFVAPTQEDFTARGLLHEMEQVFPKVAAERGDRPKNDGPVLPDRDGLQLCADVADVSERVRARRRQRRRRPDGTGATPRQPRAGETPSNRTPLDEMEANIDEFKRDIERAFYEGMARALGNRARRAFEEGLGHLNPAEELEAAAGQPDAADATRQAQGEGVERRRDPAHLEPRDPGGSGRTGDLGRLHTTGATDREFGAGPVRERPIQPPPSRG